jgi:drug/metabolite transporter (DMT)-like permease
MSAPESVSASCYADRKAVVACLLFSACSASLLIVNKVIMHFAGLPSFISCLQFLSSIVVAMLVMVQGWAKPDPFDWRKVKPYLVYVSLFVTTIYSNFKALELSNVETLIVARSCVPCVVAFLDWGCLGRYLPSARSWIAMLVMVAGAAGYVLCDKQFEADGISAYFWVILYFVVISFEMALGKYVVGPHLNFASMWGPTLYTNTLSIFPMALIGLASNEQSRLCEVEWSVSLVCLVALSCIIGVAISFLGFKARSLVSATCFTVLGVANKIATVAVNAFMWDQHASPLGILALLLTLFGASVYQQSGVRPEKNVALIASDAAKENALDIEMSHESRHTNGPK